MKRNGFTLIELMIVIVIISLMVGVYYMVANPAGQLAVARNNTRNNHLQSILLAIRSNVADQLTGQFSCSSGALPTTTAEMTSAVGTSTYNIAPCLIPIYMKGAMPFDPSAPGAHFNSVSDYDTGYTVMIDASGTITLTAPSAELSKPVSVKG